MVRNPGNYVAQPGVRIDVVEATGLDQRVDGGRAVTATVPATEGPVSAPNGNGPDPSLRCVVRHANPAVMDKAGKAAPTRQHVVDRLGQITLARQSAILLAQVKLEVGNKRGNVDLPPGEPLVRALTPDLALGGKDRVHLRHDLEGERRTAQPGLFVERTTRMSPAGSLLDGPWLTARRVESIMASIGVGLQDAAIAGELALRMGAGPVAGVIIDHSGWVGSAEGSAVADSRPDPAGSPSRAARALA